MKLQPMTAFELWLYNHNVMDYDYYMNEAPNLPSSTADRDRIVRDSYYEEWHRFSWLESKQGMDYWANIVTKFQMSLT